MDRKRDVTRLGTSLAIALAGFCMAACALEDQMERDDQEEASAQSELELDDSDGEGEEDATGDPDVAAREALAGPYWWRDVATQMCLDSNTSGDVYSLGCNGGSFQLWTWTGSSSSVQHRNLATGLCLTSSPSGDGPVYTSGCQDGFTGQRWRRDGLRWISVYSGKCLDSNTLGEVYTLPCNGGNFQNWE